MPLDFSVMMGSRHSQNGSPISCGYFDFFDFAAGFFTAFFGAAFFAVFAMWFPPSGVAPG